MPDKEVPLEFPSGGIDVTKEFQQQPEGTCADALNVRAVDAIERRGRGGSRPGLSQYVPARVPGGALTIQHLAVIVDPTVAALTQNFVTPQGDWVAHPRFPGLLIPPGGAGWQPNPNANQPGGIAFVQQGSDRFLGGLGGSVALASAVAAGELLVCQVTTEQQDAGAGDLGITATVVNGVGTPYTHAGAYAHAGTSPSNVGDFHMRTSLWYLLASGVAADKTVTVTPSAGNDNTDAELLHYRGNKTSGVLTAVVTAEQNDGVTASISTGNVASTTGDVLVVALGGYGVTVTPPTVPTTNLRANGIAGGIQSAADRLRLTAPENPISVTFSLDSPYSALVAATFKKA